MNTDIEPKISRRINVIGTSGSGKTTTAAQIAKILRIAHIELDALNWGPNWTETPPEEFRSKVIDAVSGNAWVVDGNYGRIREVIWPRVKVLIWLDYPILTIMLQLLTRTFRRSLAKEELWAGNRESLRLSFFSRDSILLWALQTYKKNRIQYPLLFAQPEYDHLEIIRLRSPRATKRWLSNLR